MSRHHGGGRHWGICVEMLKSVFGVLRVLFPVLYFGGLFFYFLDYAGSVQEAEAIGLGPYLVGLGAVGLLLCIPLIVKIVSLLAGPRSPGSGGRGGTDAPPGDDEGGFDADAVVARYLSQRSLEAAQNTPVVAPAKSGAAPARRPGFGRKIR